MSVRTRTEEIERAVLAPWATLSASSKGREHPIGPDDLRTEFQRDRDRILHTKSFRRLKHKTQVFLHSGDDHYRTRLTHTLEVAQIARTICRSLRLNEDLVESIALAHDLGHTPFGHVGEEALATAMGRPFKHNVQSLRVVDHLERDGRGLNLTWEVRDGILNHTWSMPEPSTPEARVARWADRIAYVNHDIEDAIRAGVVSDEDLPVRLVSALGDSHGRRIDRMVRGIVGPSLAAGEVVMDPEVAEALGELRSFLFDRVYLGPARADGEKAAGILTRLHEHYVAAAEELPPAGESVPGDLVDRAADYVSGMTDRFAVRTFERLFVPGSGAW